jgi:hypothetical protein
MRYALALALCFTLSWAHAQYPSFGPQLPKQMKAGVWYALYRPQKSLDRVSLETLPFVSKVETGFNSDTDKTIIHLQDWHFVTPEQFEADTPDGDYEKFLHDVETLQIEHITIMRCLAKHFGVTKLYNEGLTDRDMPIFHLKIKAMEKLEDELNGYEAELRKPSEADDEKVKLIQALLEEHRQSTLRLGIGWQLLRWKVIEEVLPLEDEDAFEAANPV